MFRTLTPLQHVADGVVALGFLLVIGVPSAWYEPEFLAVALPMAAALGIRRWSPGLALGLVWLGAIVQMVLQLPPGPVDLAIFAVLYVTAAYGNTLVRWLGFASIFAGSATIVGYLGTQAGFIPTTGNSVLGWLASSVRFGIVYGGISLVGFLLSWTSGLLVRTAIRARASRREAILAEQEVAAEQERTRIARDMHDVVAHSLAIVVAQADGARYLGKKDPKATEQALATIAGTARDALSDVRMLLAQLRYSQVDGPQPTLVDLDRLVEQLRASGLTIALETSGEPLPLGTAQQLAVYRIVQESLTNALRHADVSQEAVLRFAWSPHGLELTVTSALAGDRHKTPYGPGHGIAGMTERALLVGGWLTALPDDDRFIVRAWLPAHPEGALDVPAEVAQ